jgi:uncharacterized pyridoxal phosphate-containing UPF0001 family protein
MSIKDNLDRIMNELPARVKLVAVSKFHPVERLMEAYNAGQRLFGENRPQEFAAKVPLMPADVQWHFIGHLQTNKLKLVLPYASLVESVDSVHLLEAINAWGAANGKVVPILLELHLGAEETKHGFSEEDIIDILLRQGISSRLPQTESSSLPSAMGPCRERFRGPRKSADFWGESAMGGQVVGRQFPDATENVRYCGLMGMATNTDDEAVIEADFARIEALFNRIREEFPELRDTFTELSIGMSGDWPLAVKHGATIVRIGTDIFGNREY